MGSPSLALPVNLYSTANNAKLESNQMAQLKDVGVVKAVSSGFMVGFKTWKLTAYDRNKVIAEVSKDMGNNQAKFKAFSQAVHAKGYRLTAEQVHELNETLTLSIKFWDNSKIPYQDWIKML